MSAAFDRMTAVVVAALMALAPATTRGAAPGSDDGEPQVSAPDEEPKDAETDPEADPEADSETEADADAEAEPETPDPGHQEAVEAFAAGTKAYELGRYAEAIEHFERSWELSQEPQLLYNLGQAHWRWFDVDPNLEHLRNAKVFFENYDKRMRTTEFYNPTEVAQHVETIAKQIEEEEKKRAEALRPIVNAPSMAAQRAELERQRELERQHRITRGLNASGVAFIVLGSVALGVGLASLTARAATGAVLDNSTGGDGGTNLASAEQDADRRQRFEVAGKVAFAGFIAGAVILPVGITLRVYGKVREKRGLGPPKVDNQSSPKHRPKTPPPEPRVSVGPSGSLVTVHF